MYAEFIIFFNVCFLHVFLVFLCFLMIVLRDSSKSRQITNTTSEVSESVINPSSKKDESASNDVGRMEAPSTSAQFAQDEKGGHICCMARC